MQTRIKVCGITTLADARMCVEEGVDTLGLNFWHGSPRCCERAIACDIVQSLAGVAEIVAVVVNAGNAEVRSVLDETGIQWVQFHGTETPEEIRLFLPDAYKALRVGSQHVDEEASRYGGEHLLLDAAVPGTVGGTGQTFDWSLALKLAETRKLTLAGGLHAGNVEAAIAAVHPYRIDVASGVERSPGIKERSRVHALVRAVRRSW